MTEASLAAGARTARTTDSIPGGEMATAVPLFGLALLVFNDAVIKTHWPGVVSGKLSDFGVVLYFPFLLTATFALAAGVAHRLLALLPRAPQRPNRLTRRRLVVGMAVTTFSLSAVNLSTQARDAYLVLLDHLDALRLMPKKGYTVDPTDLLGLTMLPVVWWWGHRLMRKGEGVRE